MDKKITPDYASLVTLGLTCVGPMVGCVRLGTSDGPSNGIVLELSLYFKRENGEVRMRNRGH